MKAVRCTRYSVILICSILLLSGCSHSGRIYKLAETEIDSLGNAFIPDQRTGIRDIIIESGGKGILIVKGETTSPELKTAIIKALSNHVNSLIDSVIILPDTLSNKKYMGLATLSVINLRKHPAHSAELVSQAILGTPLMLLKSEDSWFLVQTPDKYLGWVEKSSVVPLDIAGLNEWRRSDRVISLVNSDWIYATADKKEIAGDMVAGCILVRTGDLHGITKVSFPDGRTGYVNSSSVADFGTWKASVRCTGGSVLKSAATFMGLPYLWGGTSSRAVDCSGFTKTVYFLNGLILSRDASQQALHGMNVDITGGYSHLEPGDLLFFGTRSDSQQHVTHVAIYEGENVYINSSGRVKTDSLPPVSSGKSSRVRSSLLAARRVIGCGNDPGIVRINVHPWY